MAKRFIFVLACWVVLALSWERSCHAMDAVNAETARKSANGNFPPQLQGMLFRTGFESGERYPIAVGGLDGQGGPVVWRVKDGAATVQTNVSAHGAQAVETGPGNLEIRLDATNAVLWIDAFYFDSGTTNPPLLPSEAIGGMIFFSATKGILALDGDGQGRGIFVQVVPSFPTNQFVRVTLRADYEKQRYDVWIDGTLKRAGLGFKDNSVLYFSGSGRSTDRTGFMDDFSVSTWGLDTDRDGDGLNDLDEAKFYGSDPLLADSDGDGINDAQEVLAGTNPADPESRFAIRVVLDAQGNRQVLIPTVTGRQYTLQRRAALEEDPWENVPGIIGVSGDGGNRVFLETNTVSRQFFRALLVKP